jgi:hypothetical protein
MTNCNTAGVISHERHLFSLGRGKTGIAVPYCTRCRAVNPRWHKRRCAATDKSGKPCGRESGKAHAKITSHVFTRVGE